MTPPTLPHTSPHTSTPIALLTRFHEPGPSSDICIARTDMASYHALAPLHYRAGPPATSVLVLGAHRLGHAAGVLVVSMPVLNADWRARVWPDLAPVGDKPALARRVNDTLRTISRVIVDPRHRGLGVARALVEAYLSDPLTPRSEALASMGRAVPFFERAGMRRVERAEPASLRALREDLTRLGVRAESLLRDPTPLARRRRVRGVITRFATSGRAGRARRDLPWPELARAAAGALLARPEAYIHDSHVSPTTARRGAPSRGDPDVKRLAHAHDRG